MSHFLKYVFLIIIVIGLSSCSSKYRASDIVTLIDTYMDTHAIKSYYVTIDPNNLLDEIDHKVLEKYQNYIFEKYGIVSIIIVARGFESYGESLLSFIQELLKEFRKSFDLQRINCFFSVISINDHSIAIDVTNRIKHIYNDRVLKSLIDKMAVTFDQNHLFLTIYNLLKNIEKGEKQFEQNGIITEL